MSLVGDLLVWAVVIGIIIIFLSIAVSYLPETVKRWVKEHFFKTKEK